MSQGRFCRFKSTSLVRLSSVLAAVGCTASGLAQTPVGTEFTYQGRLTESGSPADGSYDFRIELWNAASGGGDLGHYDILNWPVTDGLFNLPLNTTGQFGQNAFNGDARWLQIRVRPVGGSWQLLAPRQPLTAAPYALTAMKVPGIDGNSLNAADGSPADALVVGVDGTVAIGSSPSFAYQLNVVSSEFDAIRGRALHASNFTTGVTGETYSTADLTAGVWGVSYATSGFGRGVFGQSDSPSGYGGYFQGRGFFSSDVGIGTTPEAPLHVRGAQTEVARCQGDSQYGTWFNLFNANVPERYWRWIATGSGNGEGAGKLLINTGSSPYSGSTVMTFEPHGSVGIGVNTPKQLLHNAGDYYGRGHLWFHAYEGDGQSGTAYVQARDDSGTSSIDLQFRTQNGGVVRDVMHLSHNGDATIAPGAITRVSVLEITGADLAEKFPVSERVEPGMVVAIDANKPGELCLARGAYDRRLAGVVSGANNFPVGAVLGNLPGHEDAPPIALSGRVYVWCDAAAGAIQPGDLLTTAAAPGHAMRVDDPTRAQGAIIGKAMTNLESGRGLVLVLVSLQ